MADDPNVRQDEPAPDALLRREELKLFQVAWLAIGERPRLPVTGEALTILRQLKQAVREGQLAASRLNDHSHVYVNSIVTLPALRAFANEIGHTPLLRLCECWERAHVLARVGERASPPEHAPDAPQDDDAEQAAAHDDPFLRPWWTYPETFAWVYGRGEEDVRHAATLARKAGTRPPLIYVVAAAVDCRSGATKAFERAPLARQAIERAIQAGRIECMATKDGLGDHQPILEAHRADIAIYERMDWRGAYIAPTRHRPGATEWRDLRFKREAVLAEWPAPENTDPAEPAEQGVPVARAGRKPASQSLQLPIHQAYEAMVVAGTVQFGHGGLARAAEALHRLFPAYQRDTVRRLIQRRHNELKARRAAGK